ncbi:MAG: acyl-CoA desaturase [Gemmatimonadota bacterium]|nr:acyl-CoA desaturase [Gemmatimonadota bacterium]
MNAPAQAAASMTTVKFARSTSREFVKELKQRVEEYFKEESLSKKANGQMVLKTLIMLTLVFGSYAAIMSNQVPLWGMLGLAIVMGVGAAGCGFGIAHDALHGAYTSSKAVNGFLGLSFELNGASSYLWKIIHNVIHHTYTNIEGIDEDLAVSPLLRLSPLAEHKPIHRFQHFYVMFAYSLTTLFWVFVKDFKYIFQRDLGPYKDIRHPKTEIAKLILMKGVYYTYLIVLPLMFLDVTWWQFAIGFLALHFTAGIILSLVFQLAHVNEGPEHFKCDEQDTMEDAWLVHQMKTTTDFARSNKLLCWYVAGLNFQVEHHLFPKVCSVHYPAIAPIVQEVAEKHGVPYHTHETFMGAIAAHWRTLKEYGKPPAGDSTVLAQV